MATKGPDPAPSGVADPAAAEDRSVLERSAPAPGASWAYGPEPQQCADVYAPDSEPDSVVLLIHGGYWRPDFDRTHLRPMAADLARRGHLVVSLEYRREPGQPDRTIADVATAFRELPALLDRYGASSRPVVVAGHSAGGHLALWLAGQVEVPCLGLAPVADLVLADSMDLDEGAARAFLGGPAVGRPDLDPARRPTPGAPVIVVHGTADVWVPIGMSRTYAGHRPGVELVELPGVDHFAVIDPVSRAWPTVTAALARLAANPSAAARAGIE